MLGQILAHAPTARLGVSFLLFAKSLAKESKAYCQSPSRSYEQVREIAILSLAIASVSSALIYPIASDALNSACYLTCFLSSVYKIGPKDPFDLTNKSLYLFGAAAAMGLVASASLPLSGSALITANIAGAILSAIEQAFLISKLKANAAWLLA